MIGAYPFGSDSPSTSVPESALEIDNLLAGAGYRVRSTDLRHVALGLELLDSATAGPTVPDGVHYNPSDLTAWVDSMLSEFSSPQNNVQSSLGGRPLPPPQPTADTWTDQISPPQHQQPPTTAPMGNSSSSLDDEENTSIHLVHLLMSTADAVQRGEAPLAASLIDDMRRILTRVTTAFGIGKVAGYFIDALSLRLINRSPLMIVNSFDFQVLYHHFYESAPYLKFAHFTSNQAILEAFDGHERVHVVDFNLMHGLQWPALIQALALRPGGPPSLRLTGIGPPSPDGRDALREVGLHLAELARSVHVRFAFRGVAANRLDDVKPWMLQVAAGEAVAVNSVMQLHKLLGEEADAGAEPLEPVLTWIAGLKPKIVTLIEQEADHNKPAFLDRFTEALFYYSTVLDSLEMGRAHHNQHQQSSQLAEIYLQREICNIVCCEGPNRVERHEPLAKWRVRMNRAGLKPVYLGSNAFKQARMLLTLFSGEGYGVDEVDGCLMLGWHSRPLMSASAWWAGDDDVDTVEEGFVADNGRDVTVNNNNNKGANSSNSSSGRNMQARHCTKSM